MSTFYGALWDQNNYYFPELVRIRFSEPNYIILFLTVHYTFPYHKVWTMSYLTKLFWGIFLGHIFNILIHTKSWFSIAFWKTLLHNIRYKVSWRYLLKNWTSKMANRQKYYIKWHRTCQQVLQTIRQSPEVMTSDD